MVGYYNGDSDGGGAGGPTLRIRCVGDVSMYREDAGQLSSQGDTTDDEPQTRRKVEGSWVYPPLAMVTADTGLEEVETYVARRHSCTVHFDQTHYASVSGGRVAPWGVSVPVVEVIG